MSKNIVVCCDGTGNEYGDHNTNVVKLYEALFRDANQVAFYDPGVGTYSIFDGDLGRCADYFLGKVSPWARRLDTILAKAFGAGLKRNMEDAYRYLMDHYQPDDKVFLFGFSRGAYTARALAGMLYRCGLLQQGNANLLPYVSRIYHAGVWPEWLQRFKKTYCHDCRPHLIGVWDTVGSMGWFWGRTFFDTELNNHVKYGYHAISIDEQRKKYPVSLWNDAATAGSQTIQQVWFPGFHSDVGGWYHCPTASLSDTALVWMLKKAQAQGLRLKEGWWHDLKPNPSGRIHPSRTGLWRLSRPAPRVIPQGAMIHGSVLARMRVPTLNYKPRLPCQYMDEVGRNYKRRWPSP